MKSSLFNGVTEISIDTFQANAFASVKIQIADKGLTESALHMLRNSFIDYPDSTLSEVECLGYMESLTLIDTVAETLKESTELRTSFNKLYVDLMKSYVDKRANRASALYQKIPVSTLGTKAGIGEPNNAAYTADFEQLSAFVSCDILTKGTRPEAILAADRWMQIMQISFDNRKDLQTVSAINAALKAQDDVVTPDILSKQSQKINERFLALENRNNIMLRTMTTSGVIPCLGIYKKDLEFIKDQNLNNNDNASTANVELKTNLTDKLRYLQLELQKYDILKLAPELLSSEANPTDIETIFTNAFNLLSSRKYVFKSLTNGVRKSEYLLTALALKEEKVLENSNFLRLLIATLQPNELEDFLEGICRNIICKENSYTQKHLLQHIERNVSEYKKMVELSLMIAPNLIDAVHQLTPEDRNEVLINLSKRSAHHHGLVLAFINTNIDDQTMKDELTKRVTSITPASPNYTLLEDGKTILWELLSKRLLQQKAKEKYLEDTRKIITPLNGKEDADTVFENKLLELQKYTGEKVEPEKQSQRKEISLIISDMNTKHKTSEKISYLDSAIKAKIRPKSSFNNFVPSPLSKTGLKLLKELRDALEQKKIMDDAKVEKLQMAFEGKQGKRVSLRDTEGYRGSMSMDSQVFASNSNYNSMLFNDSNKSTADDRVTSIEANVRINRETTVDANVRATRASSFLGFLTRSRGSVEPQEGQSQNNSPALQRRNTDSKSESMSPELQRKK